MSPRPRLSLVLCLLALFVAAARGEPKRPNVVLVITDDQGYGDVGVHGNSMIRTPNLDRLHRDSIRLTDYHVDPTCSPTRSAILTGRYSTRTGVWHTIMGRSLMNEREDTLAEVFARGGYRTGMFGKWHLGDNWPQRPQDQGFEEAFYHGGGGVGQGPDAWGNDYFDDTYFRHTPEGTQREKVEGYCTDVWFENALSFVEKYRDWPFFLYLSTNAPHGPYLVDKKYSEPYAEKGVGRPMAEFYGMIENIDENLGRLNAQLDRLGLAENTIFIFTTDNGSAAGWRGRKNAKWPGYNAGMRAGKGSEYDGGHRVPFFIRWPAGGIGGAEGRKGDVSELSAHIDVLPTLAELAGIRGSRAKIDGQSLVPLLKGKAQWPARTLFVHSQRIPYPEKWRKCAVMTERWRLVRADAAKDLELYDIEADPGQRNNLAGEHPAVVAKLRLGYESWWKSLEPSFAEEVRIGLGGRESPTWLHPHDWHVENQGLSSWHQNHVRKGHKGRGFWAVDVAAAGEYEFRLRRWPDGIEGPLEASKARLSIGELALEKDLAEDAEEVRFRAKLPAGPARLETLFTLPDGSTRGAYFVWVTRL